MPRYSAWKTVIGGAEKRHRSENATYKWLREWAAEQPDGTRVAVYVQESTRKGHWYTFEEHVVRSGMLTES
jgi:hypothetical protein